MDVREILSLVRAWLVVIVATVALSAGAAFIVSSRSTPTYEAETTLLVGPPLTSAMIAYTDLLIAQTLAQTYTEVATSRPVLAAAATAANVEGGADTLVDTVTARTPPSSTFVIITAQASTAEQAAAIANAVAAELLKQAPPADALGNSDNAYTQSLADNAAAITTAETELSTLQAVASPSPTQAARISALQQQLASLRAERATLLNTVPPQQSNLLSVIEPAVPPKQAIGPRTLVNVALGAAIGLMVALAIIVVVENLGRVPRGEAAGEPAARRDQASPVP